MVLKYRILSSILILFIGLFGLTSFIDLSTRTIINSKITFEILFLLVSLLVVLQLKLLSSIKIYSAILFLYIYFNICYFIFFENIAKFTDFLIMYKSYIYLFILSFFIGKEYFKKDFLRKLFNLLIILFLSKYILMKILGYGFQGRPSLFAENNYELIMLLIIYIGVYSREKTIYIYDLISLLIIFILSGSRSGMASFLIMIIFMKIEYRNKILNLFKYLMFLFALIGFVYIFFHRLGENNIENIDRIKFFMYFLNEIKSWNIVNYLFGAPFMTPMSYETSKSLSYYYTLYSDYDSLLTYSVVLHSFILRTIFDHGFIGLFFLYFVVWRFLFLSGYNASERLTIILILISNAISVSSLNSIFISLALGLIFITQRRVYDKTNIR